MFCPNCGNHILDANASFCPNCGAQLNSFTQGNDQSSAQQDFQQGDTSAVPGKTVADAGGTGIAKRALFSAAVYTAGSTGYIVFCRIG